MKNIVNSRYQLPKSQIDPCIDGTIHYVDVRITTFSHLYEESTNNPMMIYTGREIKMKCIFYLSGYFLQIIIYLWRKKHLYLINIQWIVRVENTLTIVQL